jgi:hypothetical protein
MDTIAIEGHVITRISHKLSWEADLDAENCGYL